MAFPCLPSCRAQRIVLPSMATTPLTVQIGISTLSVETLFRLALSNISARHQ